MAGGSANAGFGFAISGGGDINGDGYADIAIGAPSARPGGAFNAGSVWIHLGSAAGIAAIPDAVRNGTSGQMFGASVTVGGDTNGDGFADLMVGAPFGIGSSSRTSGIVQVFLGSSSSIGATPHQTVDGAGTIVDSYAESVFGQRLAALGDVNGDGYSDVGIGAPWFTRYAGFKRFNFGYFAVYLGGSSGLSRTVHISAEGTQDGASLGESIAGLGDINGDGFGDIALGCTRNPFGTPAAGGPVLIYHGSSSGLPSSPTRTLDPTGNPVGQHIVAGVGDLRADGYADLAIGIPNASVGGLTTIYSGTASGFFSAASRSVFGVASGDQFGAAVAMLPFGQDLLVTVPTTPWSDLFAPAHSGTVLN